MNEPVSTGLGNNVCSLKYTKKTGGSPVFSLQKKESCFCDDFNTLHFYELNARELFSGMSQSAVMSEKRHKIVPRLHTSLARGFTFLFFFG